MPTRSLYPLITCLLLRLTITSAQQSQYYVQCSDEEMFNNYSVGPIDINATTLPTTLSNIKVPINKNHEQICLLRIKLIGGTYNFEENSACTITFDISEVETLSPTTLDPTKVPTSTPTVIPTVSPVATVSPTASPTSTTNIPTNIPTSSPTTSEPTSTTNPTAVPTFMPTTVPTMEPTTTESNIIDLDELEVYNIFSVNDENIFWSTHYLNGTFYGQIMPGCMSDNSTIFADELVTDKSNDGIIELRSLITDAFNSSDDITIFNVNPTLAGLTPLFPIVIDIKSHDSNISSIFSYSQSKNKSIFECYYKDAFETNINDSVIDYYLFIEDNDNTTKRENIIIDIGINKVCIVDETPMPTSSPTIDFNAFTTDDGDSTDDDGDDNDKDNFLGLGVGLEIFIAIIVVAVIILIASIIVGICLCKRKNIWEDNEDEEAIIQLKEPKTVKETELITNKFMVTEDDHAEMIELAKRSSLSTGLEV